MLKIVCDVCQEAVPGLTADYLIEELMKLGVTDKSRIRDISNQIRDGYKGEDAASDEEKAALFKFAHELIALAVYQPVFCPKCRGCSPEEVDENIC
jgi:hypothetical protein